MDRSTRIFAVGPFASREPLDALGLAPEPVVYAGTPARHLLLETEAGWFLCTFDRTAFDAATRSLGEPGWSVTLDAWNALAEGATVARIKRERHEAGAVETTWADRRHGGLAYAGVLDDVAAEWLAHHLRTLTRRPAEGRKKKAADQRTQAERFLSRLVDEGLLELAPGASVADLGARAHTILFVIRRDMAPMLERVFRSSTKVRAFRGCGADLHRCLKEAGIRPH
jgi:hypothetical protein